MSDPTVSILCAHVCRLGEGPSYDPATNTLFWFDIIGKRMFEMNYPDGEPVAHELPFMASAVAAIDAERQLLVTEAGLYIRDRASGDLTFHLTIEDRPGNRSNDARVHPCGAFWIGTMSKSGETGAGSIYWYFEGELKRLFPEITISNSICFSPDGAIAYFADTRRNILWKVACDPETGLPVGEQEILLDHGGVDGGIDGSVCDADGVIWNARWGSARIDAYGPDGAHLSTIPMPAKQTSCPVFAGADAARLAATSATQGMSPEALAADPHAGKTFLVDLAVKGRFDPPVRL